MNSSRSGRSMPRQFAFKNRWLLVLQVLVILVMAAGCSPAAAPVVEPAATQVEATVAPTATQSPSATPQPSATTAPTLEPSPTHTQEPSPTATQTATAVPPLAVLPEGFAMWCNPVDSAGAFQPGVEVPKVARVMKDVNGQLEVTIPAEFCTMIYSFNQSVPDGLEMWMFDSRQTPFLKTKLAPTEGHPEIAFAAVTQPFVVNPPFWSVPYRIEIVSPDGKILRSDLVNFAKTLPSPCTFGGWPDPVTLYCPTTDPWEVEPHPGVRYPYPTLTPSSD
jgi:hypothetical protein